MISAIVLLAIVAIPLILGGLPFSAWIAAIGLVAAYEFVTLFSQVGMAPCSSWPACWRWRSSPQAQWPVSFPCLLADHCSESATRHRMEQVSQPATDWTLTLANLLYVGWLLGKFVRRAEDQGLCSFCWAQSRSGPLGTTAYFTGRAFGRSIPVAPR